MRHLGIGDPVEVRFVDRSKGEVWLPATTVYVERTSIGVAFSDGTRQAVTKPNWRHA